MVYSYFVGRIVNGQGIITGVPASNFMKQQPESPDSGIL
jgi:hypothetical protein